MIARPDCQFPREFELACRRLGVRPARWCLAVSVRRQELVMFERARLQDRERSFPVFVARRRFLVSTARKGVGQRQGSEKTPLGLHRVARKIGGGWPIGTVFESRQPVGYLWQRQDAPAGLIAHRILWLEGLEEGFNRGGEVDTFSRYVYLHGFGGELTLGRPASHGCVHLAAADLLPLFDLLPTGSLVWISSVW